MDPFITLNELKLASDISNTSKDDIFNQVIPFACDAVRAYCGRSFDTNLVTETRTWLYDPKDAMLMIDDAQEVTEVRIGGYTVPEDSWMPMPFDGSLGTFYWIELPPYGGESPEMGFTRNADTAAASGFWTRQQKVDVDGTWGWDTVPGPVKQAAIWTASAMSDNPSPYISQNIEGYSYTRSNPMVDGIPARAINLLDPYARPLL